MDFTVWLSVDGGDYSVIAACETPKAAKAFLFRHAKSNLRGCKMKVYRVQDATGFTIYTRTYK